MAAAQLPAQSSATQLPTTLSPQQVARIQKAAQDFEVMALGQMLAPMFETVDASKGAFGGGSGEQAWQPMMVSEIGKQMAKSGGVGLARPVMEQMLRMQERREGASPAQGPQAQAPMERTLSERPPPRPAASQQAPLRPGAKR